MAAPEPGVWGIDLGQCALKAIRLERGEEGLTATAFDYVEHPKILSQPDADPDQLIREALEKFLSRNTLRGDMVAISVPGQSGLARFVKLPPVEEKKIGDIVRFEAKQQIPFNLEEVVWDYQKIGSGVVTDGFAMETEIGLFAMKRDMINRYLQHFKDVNVEVHLVQMAPLALCNYVAYDLLGKGAPGEEGVGDHPAKQCVVALDIGADASNLVITDGERVIWQRPIPLGGNHFTRALTKDLKLTFAKAEHLKRNATKSPDLKKILAALKPVLNDFVGEVQRSLGYFTNTHRDAQVEYMVGLGNAFRLPGLQRFLSEKLQLEVRKVAKLERLSGDTVVASPVYGENVLGFPVAYGLALQGLRHARLMTNLLPEEIRIERLVRAKKPWAVAAAACLGFGAFAGLLGAGWEYNAYGNEKVVAGEKKVDDVNKKLSAADSAFTAQQQKAYDEEKRVKALVAGQFEQANWLRLNRFLFDAVPRPDGTNLKSPGAVQKYWQTPREVQGATWTGASAYQEYVNRRNGKGTAGSADKDRLPRGIDYLIQFNIESVDSRYCDDLKNYWTAVRAKVPDTEKGNARPASDWDKPPEGKGWVIELRGYTYHWQEQNFVIEALVDNLARVGDPQAYDPNAAAASGGNNAATPSTSAAPAASGPVDPKIAEQETKEPIANKVSHVVLLRYTRKSVAAGDPFELSGSGSDVAELVSGAGAAVPGGVGGEGTGKAMPGMPGMPMPGMPGAPSAPAGGGGGSRGSWSPLGGFASGGGGGGGGMRAGMMPGMQVPPPGAGAMTGGPGRGGEGVPGGGGRGAPTGGAAHQRTEFVVLFVWREPTPSDSLRGMEGDAGTTK